MLAALTRRAQASCPFDRARPTLTHQALLALHRAGKARPAAACAPSSGALTLVFSAARSLARASQVTYLISCNVDSLHLRSGWPRGQLAELHGNCFAERCESCSAERVRDFEQATVVRASRAAPQQHAT